MNEPVHDYTDHGITMRSAAPLYNNYKVGDLVAWTSDGDIGIVTEVEYESDDDAEHFYIRWTFDARASGWHGPHPALELLSSH